MGNLNSKTMMYKEQNDWEREQEYGEKKAMGKKRRETKQERIRVKEIRTGNK